MRERSLGITALSVVTVIIGLYSLVAGIALIIAGAIGTAGDTAAGTALFALGALILGLSVAAQFVGGLFWLQRPMAWAGGMVVFGGLIVVNALALVLGSSLISAIVPVLAAAGAMWYLLRPSVKVQLLGTPVGTEADTGSHEREASKVAETTA